jgi:Rod binding domain-containing protein
MEINPLQRRIDASAIAPEKLAGNPSLTQDQKVAEASRQFEAVLLRQILSDSQKTVIPSELSDNSTEAGIYQDVITNALADNISKSGAFGLAKTFTQQLTHPDHSQANAARAAGGTGVRSGHPLSSDNLSAPQLRRPTPASATPP